MNKKLWKKYLNDKIKIEMVNYIEVVGDCSRGDCFTIPEITDEWSIKFGYDKLWIDKQKYFYFKIKKNANHEEYENDINHTVRHFKRLVFSSILCSICRDADIELDDNSRTKEIIKVKRLLRKTTVFFKDYIYVDDIIEDKTEGMQLVRGLYMWGIKLLDDTNKGME